MLGLMALSKKEKVFIHPVQVKTSPRAKLAFDRIAAFLASSERVRWFEKRVTKEVVFAAVWIWLEERGEAFIEDAMAEFLPRLEAQQPRRKALLGGESGPPGESGEGAAASGAADPGYAKKLGEVRLDPEPKVARGRKGPKGPGRKPPSGGK